MYYFKFNTGLLLKLKGMELAEILQIFKIRYSYFEHAGVVSMLVPSYVESLRSSPNINTITEAFVLINYVVFFWIRIEIFNNLRLF